VQEKPQTPASATEYEVSVPKSHWEQAEELFNKNPKLGAENVSVGGGTAEFNFKDVLSSQRAVKLMQKEGIKFSKYPASSGFGEMVPSKDIFKNPPLEGFNPDNYKGQSKLFNSGSKGKSKMVSVNDIVPRHEEIERDGVDFYKRNKQLIEDNPFYGKDVSNRNINLAPIGDKYLTMGGHHRVAAAIEMGRKFIKANVLDNAIKPGALKNAVELLKGTRGELGAPGTVTEADEPITSAANRRTPADTTRDISAMAARDTGAGRGSQVGSVVPVTDPHMAAVEAQQRARQAEINAKYPAQQVKPVTDPFATPPKNSPLAQKALDEFETVRKKRRKAAAAVGR
jgi:hypothetical protein